MRSPQAKHCDINYKYFQVVWESQLGTADEAAMQDAMLQKLAEREVGYYGKPGLPRPGAIKGAAPGMVRPWQLTPYKLVCLEGCSSDSSWHRMCNRTHALLAKLSSVYKGMQESPTLEACTLTCRSGTSLFWTQIPSSGSWHSSTQCNTRLTLGRGSQISVGTLSVLISPHVSHNAVATNLIINMMVRLQPCVWHLIGNAVATCCTTRNSPQGSELPDLGLQMKVS